jgi:hypothetical protein
MHFYETLLSNEPFQPNTSSKKSVLLKIPRFSDEAFYIYSLEKKKIVAADGWLQLLGYANSEINMHLLVSITAPDFKEFIISLPRIVFRRRRRLCAAEFTSPSFIKNVCLIYPSQYPVIPYK